MKHQFPPEYRLRSRSDFEGLRKGKRWHYKGLVCVYIENPSDHARLGMAVSTRFGNAVQRHWFKRHVREIFRQHDVRMSNLDILVFPRVSYHQLRHFPESLKTLFDQLNHRVRKSS